jgi:CHAT domain-containing protein
MHLFFVSYLHRPAKLCILLVLLSWSTVFGQNTAEYIVAQGDQAFEQGNYQEAQKQYEAALGQKAETWLKVALCYIRLGKPDEAIRLAEKRLPDFAAQSLALAEAYRLLGEAYLNKSNNERALYYLDKALDIYNTRRPADALLAQCYNTIGLAHWSEGNTFLALDFLEKSTRLQAGAAGSSAEAASFNDLGLVQQSLGNYEEALASYQKALTVYKGLYGKKHPKIAIAYTNVGIVLRSQGETLDALEYLEQAKAIWQELYGLRQHPGEAFVLSNMAQCHSEMRQYGEALLLMREALEIYMKNSQGKNPELANIYNLMAGIYTKTGEYELALAHSQKALIANAPNFSNEDIARNPTSRDYYKGRILLNSLLLKAQALEEKHFAKSLKLSELQLALRCLQQADSLATSLRQSSVSREDKLALAAISSELYQDAVRICLALAEGSLRRKYYEELAFYFAEKSKAAVLLEAISESQAKSFANIPGSLLRSEQELKSSIAFLELRLSEKPEANLEASYRERLFEERRRYEAFVQKLEQEYPEYYRLKFSGATGSLKALQQALDKETALISYFISDKSQRIQIFHITHQSLRVYDQPLREDFFDYVNVFYNTTRFRLKRLYLFSASLLYEQLFPKQLPGNIRKVVIIPDGRLSTLPFEALLTEKPNKKTFSYTKLPYLLRRYAISYSYSSSLWLSSTGQKDAQSSASMLLLAPIDFQQKYLFSLPGTAQEVEGIAALFRERALPHKSLLYTEARKEALYADSLRQYRFVHLATHGIVNEVIPARSGIFLSASNEQDNIIYAGEIYNLRLQADLVSLSACETGLGKLSKGEGIIGLSRALLYAGARRSAVSLWKVSDSSTATLMQDFYRLLLQEGKDYAEALRQAKLKLLEDSRYAQPYYWAAFILIGP